MSQFQKHFNFHSEHSIQPPINEFNELSTRNDFDFKEIIWSWYCSDCVCLNYTSFAHYQIKLNDNQRKWFIKWIQGILGGNLFYSPNEVDIKPNVTAIETLKTNRGFEIATLFIESVNVGWVTYSSSKGIWNNRFQKSIINDQCEGCPRWLGLDCLNSY